MPNDKNLRSEAARKMGQSRSERKLAAVRQNIAKALAARIAANPLAACTCGTTTDEHRQPCPVYQREYRRKRRAEMKNKETETK